MWECVSMMNADRKRKDRDAFLQGLLYFVDSDDRDTISKRDLHARVTNFLSQHAFYYYGSASNKPDHRKLTTVASFFQQATNAVRKEVQIPKLQVPGEELFNALYRIKSDGLSAEFLKKHKYSKPFDPSALPGPPENEDHLGSGDHVPQSKMERHGYIAYARHLAIQAVDAAKTSSERDDWKFRDRASRIAAFDSLCQQFDIKRKGKNGSILDFKGEYLLSSLTDYYDKNYEDYGARSFGNFFAKGSDSVRSTSLEELAKLATDFAEAHGLRLPAILPEIRPSVEDDGAELTSPDDMPLSKRRLPREFTEHSPSRIPSKRRAITACIKDKQRTFSTATEASPTNTSFCGTRTPKLDFSHVQQLHREMIELCKSTVQDLMSQISLDANQPSPLLDTNDPTISKLCSVIFGDMHAMTCQRLRSLGYFKASEVLHALIGSWIYTEVLQSHNRWERKAFSLPKMKEMRQIFLNLSSPNPVMRREARQQATVIIAQEILARARDDDLLFEEIADTLGNEFMPSLATQMTPLVTIASQLNRSDEVELDHMHLATRLRALVVKAMELKLNLDIFLRGEYDFWWPKTCDVFEVKSHSAVGGIEELGFVAYTMFPGVRAKKACGGNDEVHFLAQVVCCRENPGVEMESDERVLE